MGVDAPALPLPAPQPCHCGLDPQSSSYSPQTKSITITMTRPVIARNEAIQSANLGLLRELHPRNDGAGVMGLAGVSRPDGY